MAKKQLNKTVVVGIALFGFLMAICASVLMLRQLRTRDPQHYINLAERYESEEDFPTAAMFFKEAWERSGDPAHLVAHGRMWLREGEFGRALGSWRTVLTNDPGQLAAHRALIGLHLELARLYGLMGDWTAVNEAAEAFADLSADLTADDQAVAEHARGLALVNLKRLAPENAQQGRDALELAVELAPTRVDFAIDLARIDARLGHLPDSQQRFAALLDQYEQGLDASRVRIAYGEHLVEQQEPNKAEPYFRAALELAESDIESTQKARVALARFLTQAWAISARDGRDEKASEVLFDEAEALLKAASEAIADDFEPYLRLAVLYKAARRYDDVVRVCESRLTQGFSRRGIHATRDRLSAFTLMLHAAESAVVLGAQALEDNDPNERKIMLARAEQYVTDARGEFPNHPAVLSRSARVKLARGHDRAALADLRQADEIYRSLDTFDWETKILMARVHLRLREAGTARSVLEEVLPQAQRDRGGDTNFWIVYAQTLMETGDLTGALSIGDQVLAANPTLNEAVRLRAAILELRGRRREATALVQGVTTDPIIRAILQARQHSLDDQPDQAIRVLRTALANDPSNARLVGVMVRELTALDRLDEAKSVVDEGLAIAPNDLLLQRIALSTDPTITPEERDQTLMEAIESLPDAYQRSLELIGFYVRKKEIAKAIEQINIATKHLAAKDTSMAQNATLGQYRALLTTKMGIAARLEDAATKQATLAEARDEAARYDVDGCQGKSILGLYHMHRGEYELARTALKQAVRLQPSDSRSLARLGQSAYLLGHSDEAREWYEQSIRANPSEGEAYKGLAALAKQIGDQSALNDALDKCAELIPWDTWVRRALADRADDADPSQAIIRRMQRLADAPNDADNLRKLAELSEKTGQFDQADGYYATLSSLQPNDKEIVVATLAYYRRTDRPELALKYVTEYIETRPTPEEHANAHILLASHYIALGNPERAEQSLLAAADIATTLEIAQSLGELYQKGMDRPLAARPWLERAALASKQRKAEQRPLLLASLALCLMDRRVDDLPESQRVLDQLRIDFPSYAHVPMLQARLFARSGRVKDAVSALSEFLADRPDDAQALYQRALHRCSQGRYALAMKDLKTLSRAHPKAIELNPRLLLARLYRLDGRASEQIDELESMVRDAPESAKAAEALAQAYIEDRRLDKAQRLVTQRINQGKSSSDPRWHFLRGRLALDRQDEEAALDDYQLGAQISGYESAAVTEVLDVFLELKRFGEGVDFFERYASATNPSAGLVSRFARLLTGLKNDREAVGQFRKAMGLAMRSTDRDVRVVSQDLEAAFAPETAVSLFQASPPGGDAGRANDRILVRLHRNAKQFDQAMAILERLIAGATDSKEQANLWSELGDICQNAHRVDQAYKAYRESLKIDDDNWITLNNLAYLLADQMGEHRRAQPYAERAAQLSDDPNTLDTLGWIYVGLAEYSSAVAELSRAIRLNPADALPYYHLAEAYRRSGRFDEAIEIIQTGQRLASSSNQSDLESSLAQALAKTQQLDQTP